MTRADLAAYVHRKSVVKEALRELEGIVRSLRSLLSSAILYTEVDIDGFQCASGNVLDFTLQESIQGPAGFDYKTSTGLGETKISVLEDKNKTLHTPDSEGRSSASTGAEPPASAGGPPAQAWVSTARHRGRGLLAAVWEGPQ